jgi:hypothetical protein
MARILTRLDIWRRHADPPLQQEADCLPWARQRLRAQRLAERHVGTLAAYVNHGRWVADCVCGAGMAASPAEPESICIECGRHYAARFPTERAEIEQALLLRERAENRNWFPHETAADLADENRTRLTEEADHLRARLAQIDSELASDEGGEDTEPAPIGDGLRNGG